MTTTKWKLLTPRPFNWTMKPLDSAETGVKTLDDGRLEFTIRHDILQGVTPAMLGWWFRHIEGAMEHLGQTYPRYLIWHPIDHIHLKVVRRAPDGTAGPGARFHLVEAFGVQPRRRRSEWLRHTGQFGQGQKEGYTFLLRLWTEVGRRCQPLACAG